MFTALILALVAAATQPSPIAIFPVHRTVGVEYLDPIDEVAPEVCQGHGRAIGAMWHKRRGLAWCQDNTTYIFR